MLGLIFTQAVMKNIFNWNIKYICTFLQPLINIEKCSLTVLIENHLLDKIYCYLYQLI